MKKYIRNNAVIIITYSLIFLLIGGLYLVTKRSYPDTHKLKTFKQFSSQNLIHEYDSKGYDNFIEKALEINGILKKVHYKNNVYSLYLSYEVGKCYVICELQADQNHKIPNLKIGDELIIKGILKGKLLDIVLLNCIII